MVGLRLPGMVSGPAANCRHGANGWEEVAMDPIDYFISVFVGLCIGLAGLALVVH